MKNFFKNKEENVMSRELLSKDIIMGKRRNAKGSKIKGERGVPMMVLRYLTRFSSGRELVIKHYMRLDTTKNRIGGMPQI